jgi:phosphatidylglycerol:prolipoprotein diacylglycerol transferase
MLAVAFLVGTALGMREARRRGLDPDDLVTVILVILVGSIIGARALYVLEHLHEFRHNWLRVVAVWQGGLTLYGGIITGTVLGLLMARRLRMPMWPVADSLAPSVALGTAFGRVGCFLNGCCYGRPTSMPWGVVYPSDTFPGLEFGAAPLHPAQLYNALFGVTLFAVLWGTRKRFMTPGVLFWTFIVAFAFGRIVLDGFRAYEAGAQLLAFGGTQVTESQVISLAMGLFGILMIARLRRAFRPAEIPAVRDTAPRPGDG